MNDLISRQVAIDELSQRYIIMDNPHYIGYNAGLDEAQKVIKALPTVQLGMSLAEVGTYVPDMNAGDMIYRQAVIDALDCINGVEEVLRSLPSAEPTITHEQAIDYLHKTGWLQNHDRILTESKIVPSAQPDVPDTNVGDMISRQAAMKRLMAQNVIMDGSEYHNGFNAGVNRAQEVIKNLPPVQPKRGYWTESHEHIYMGNVVKEWTNWYCSECDAPNDKPTDFCPNCGADMRGDAECVTQ